MAIHLGKREQIVGLSLAGIITIFLLHLVVLGPRMEQYNTAYEAMKKGEADVSNIQILKQPNQIKELEKDNEKIAHVYSDVVTSLGLTMDPIFDLPTLAQFDFTAPKGTDEKLVPALKEAAFKEDMAKKEKAQIELIYDEIKKLIKVTQESATPGSKKTQFSFLGEFGPPGSGWFIPKTLPADLRGGKLQDRMCDIRQLWKVTNNIAGGQRALQQAAWEASMGKLGINYTLYRDPARLPAQGEYVPLIHKLAYAILIEQALPEGILCDGEKITRDKLFEILQIDVPLPRLLDSERRDLNINEMYFIYEELRLTNRFIKIATETGVADLMKVSFEDAAYLVAQSQLPFAAPITGDPPAPTPSPTPKGANPFVLPRQEAGLPERPPGERKGHEISARSPIGLDQGYCLPVSIQMKASNLAAWSFIYEVLREFRLDELEKVRFVPWPDNTTDVGVETKFLHIPFIFALEKRTPLPTPTPAPTPTPPM